MKLCEAVLGNPEKSRNNLANKILKTKSHDWAAVCFGLTKIT